MQITTERQQYLLHAALQYAKSNIDDLNDAFASFSDEDEDNLGGQIKVNNKVMSSFEEEELNTLLDQLYLPSEENGVRFVQMFAVDVVTVKPLSDDENYNLTNILFNTAIETLIAKNQDALASVEQTKPIPLSEAAFKTWQINAGYSET